MVITDVFANGIEIPLRAQKPFGSQSMLTAIDSGRSKSQLIEDYDQYSIEKTFLYGANKKLHEAFHQNGYIASTVRASSSFRADHQRGMSLIEASTSPQSAFRQRAFFVNDHKMTWIIVLKLW